MICRLMLLMPPRYDAAATLSIIFHAAFFTDMLHRAVAITLLPCHAESHIRYDASFRAMML